MRRSTGIYILLLAGLFGLYYYLNNRPPKTEEETIDLAPAPAVEYLFTAEYGLPSTIRVQSREGEIVEIKRNKENAWVLTQPVEASAEQGAAEAAASQVSTIRVLDHVPGLALDAVGLKDPAYTFTLQFTGDVERIVKIGVLTPTETGYYANTGDSDVLIISNNAVDALIELLTNPPYAPTETPLPPTPEADTTSTVTATPQP